MMVHLKPKSIAIATAQTLATATLLPLIWLTGGVGAFSWGYGDDDDSRSYSKYSSSYSESVSDDVDDDVDISGFMSIIGIVWGSSLICCCLCAMACSCSSDPEYVEQSKHARYLKQLAGFLGEIITIINMFRLMEGDCSDFGDKDTDDNEYVAYDDIDDDASGGSGTTLLSLAVSMGMITWCCCLGCLGDVTAADDSDGKRQPFQKMREDVWDEATIAKSNNLFFIWDTLLTCFVSIPGLAYVYQAESSDAICEAKIEALHISVGISIAMYALTVCWKLKEILYPNSKMEECMQETIPCLTSDVQGVADAGGASIVEFI
jgi:hypothetical protein